MNNSAVSAYQYFAWFGIGQVFVGTRFWCHGRFLRVCMQDNIDQVASLVFQLLAFIAKECAWNKFVSCGCEFIRIVRINPHLHRILAYDIPCIFLNLDLASDSSFLQTICFELRSRQRKSVTWIWPVSIRDVKNFVSISIFNVRGVPKNKWSIFINGCHILFNYWESF